MFNKKFPISSFYMDDEELTKIPHAHGISIFEEGDSVVIEAALPGVNSDMIEVTHAPGYILIEGEREHEEQNRKYYRKACSSYSYRIPIPAAVDLSKEPEAVFKDGIMKVKFKKGAKKGKSIPVKDGK